MVTGDLALRGTLTNIGLDGVFLEAHVVVEPGELGKLTVDGSETEVTVRVVWARSATDDIASGMGLARSRSTT